MNRSGDHEQAWYDEDAGPLIRPYAITKGRTRPASSELDLITLVVRSGIHPRRLDPEYEHVLDICEVPQSVAEVGAKTGLPLGVVKVLIGDLIERNYLIFRSRQTHAMPDLEMMQKVLDGIRRL